ncbi:MAG: pyruvate dehydrogenase (acetyl-transferring) E1 component subunit alpha [Chloroflexota bacterium]
MATRDIETALSNTELLDLYYKMLLIRHFEEKAAEMYALGKIGGFTHLYIGQEAVAVGAISTLRPDDYVISNYREHGHAIAKGSDPKRIMAELFGKDTGLSRGRGGSMHLFDAEHGFLGGYAIVGGGMPLAAGVALAISYRGADQVVLCFFGDGAINEGAFHESLNLAAIWRLPVVFIIENNQFAMGTAVEKVTLVKDLYQRACAYGIPGDQADGMDVLGVRQATRTAVERARSGEGPTLLEALTYRFRGHSMADPMYYRTKREEEPWKARDPLKLFGARLRGMGILTDQDVEALEQRAQTEVEAAVAFAEESPLPRDEDLYENTCVDSFCPAYVRGGV